MDIVSINPREPANWIVGLAVLVVGVNGVIFRRHELDDSLIYARYIQNLISGNGLVYNVGEYVNGLTSPLFAWLSLAPAYLFSDARQGAMLISVLAAMGTLVIFYRILTLFVAERWIAALAALLAAGSSITYINLGMETSLFTFMVGTCLYLYFKDKFFPLGICIGLSILVRPESMFLVPAMALNTLIFKRQWPELKCYIIPAILVLTQLIFNGIYYDTLLPTSGVAKISQGTLGHWGFYDFFFDLFRAFLYGFGLPGQLQIFDSYFITVLLMLLASLSLLLVQARQYLVVSFVFLLLYTAFFTILNIPSQWWYYAIYYSIYTTYIAFGIYWLCDRINRVNQVFMKVVFVGVFSIMLLWQGAINLALLGNTVREDYKQFGEWIAQNTPAGASIALAEIGTVGWYSDRRIIDILGLVTRGNADLIAEGDYHSWLASHPPDYILASEPPRFFESAVTMLKTNRPQYLDEVAGFDFPGFKLYRYLPTEAE